MIKNINKSKIIIKNVFHGSKNEFKFFDDAYLGIANGTGYIKGHWFAKSSNIKDSEKAARHFARNNNPYFIYNVTIEVDEISICNVYDKLFDKLDKENIKNIKNNYKIIDEDTTIREFIQNNEEANEILINMNLLVICGWEPDNGLVEEYISVLTTKKNNCKININYMNRDNK